MKIRVGILGCASIAKRSLMPAFRAHPSFEIVAVASRSLDKASPLSDMYHCVACGYDELVVRKDVDLVYCPLPTGLHYEWVARSIKSGKHVLCEKSLATSLKEVEELISLAKANKRFIMESFQFRFHSQNLYVRQLINERAIGEIRCVRAQFGFPPFPDGCTNIRYSKALGGGALLDAGAYTLKATTFLLGHNVDVLGSTSWSKPGFEVDLGGTIYLESNDGVVSETAYGFDNFYQCGYEVWGSKGKLALTRAFTARADFSPTMILETSDGRTEKKLDKDDHFARLLDYISDCLANNRFDAEYRECLTQARLIEGARNGGYIRR